MDAFAVSVSNSMCYRNLNKKFAMLDAIFFGVAQGVMPMIGWGLGQTFKVYIEAIDHYIALILLSYIGIRMIAEGVKKIRQPEMCLIQEKLTIKILSIQAIATSIDALTIGISLAAMPGKVTIGISSLIIGVVTFLCSEVGILIGKKFGKLIEEKAQILGGVLLCLIGIKIFLEHVLGG